MSELNEPQIINEKKKRIRYKDWKCIYPGCIETPKTKYNCTTHVWDAHLKFVHKEYNYLQFKNIKDKTIPKKLCEQYIKFCPDEVNIRKRKTISYIKQEEKGDCINEFINEENENQMNLNNYNQLNDTNNLNQGNYTFLSLPSIPITNTNNQFQLNVQNNSNNSQGQSSPESRNENNQMNNSMNLNQIQNQFIHHTHSSENHNELLPSFETSDFNELPPIISCISSSDQKSSQHSSNINQFNQFNYLNNSNQNIQNNQLNKQNQYQQQFNQNQSNEFIQVLQISPSLKQLHIIGRVFSENGFFQRSDERMKTKIQPIKDALNRLLKVTGRMFTYNDDNRQTYGFLAQELQNEFPELVVEDHNGYLSVDPISLIPFIVESVKSLDKELTSIETTYNETIEILNILKQLSKSLNQFTVDYSFTLGPVKVTVPFAMIFTTISVLITIIYPSLPFLWGYFALLSLTFWYSSRPSNDLNRKGFKEIEEYNKGFIQYYICLAITIGLICCAFTFLFGTSLKCIGVYFVSILIWWLFSLFSQNKKNVIGFYLLITITFAITVCVLSFIQPGYNCNATVNEEFISVNKTPWNCLYPEIGLIVENNVNNQNYQINSFERKDLNEIYEMKNMSEWKDFHNEPIWMSVTGNVILNPLQERNSTISIFLKCSNFINFECKSY